MRIIITGGTGLIGKALTNSLAKDGNEIIVLSRNKNKSTAASTATWTPEMTSAWKVPVRRKFSVQTFSSLEDSPIKIASIIPTALGLNPSLTISALSLRIADTIIAEL